MAEYVKRENSRGYLPAVEKARAVEVFYSYLFDLNRTIRAKQPFVPANNGATLALRQINSALQNYWHKTREPEPGSELDLV